MSEDAATSGTPRDRIVLAVLGLALAPIIGGLGALAFMIAFSSFLNPLGWSVPSFGTFLLGAIYIAALVGWPAAVVLGIPTHLELKRRGWTGALNYFGFGALIGLATMIILMIMLNQFGGAAMVIGFMIVLAGALGGLAFWLIRRPDKDA